MEEVPRYKKFKNVPQVVLLCHVCHLCLEIGDEKDEVFVMLLRMTMMLLVQLLLLLLTYNDLTCNCHSFWFYIQSTCLNCFIALLTMLMIFFLRFFSYFLEFDFHCVILFEFNFISCHCVIKQSVKKCITTIFELF